MKTQRERILAECDKNLSRGRAVGTGIGVFAVIIKDGAPLLRRRLEKDSLYGEDLSGKWEAAGGGAEITDFSGVGAPILTRERYQGSILTRLTQEIKEEVGLKLLCLPDPLLMAPAWFWRLYEDKEKGECASIDLAFSTPINIACLGETREFQERTAKGEIKFVPRDRLAGIEFVSPRMRFLVEEALQISDITTD
ncbi:MAG: hypothetical protein PHW72_02095 [Candidatus Pacebacteria bacterium]|nr:hypothetical protein [Candidatus Paceibacterota bacterium]